MGTTNSIYWGLILILFGALFILDNFDIMNISYIISNFWPIVLILIGLKIILNQMNNEIKHSESKESNDKSNKNVNTLSETNIFGDIIIKASAENFSGGTVNNIFGNINLDLSRIKPRYNLSKVFISSVF